MACTSEYLDELSKMKTHSTGLFQSRGKLGFFRSSSSAYTLNFPNRSALELESSSGCTPNIPIICQAGQPDHAPTPTVRPRWKGAGLDCADKLFIVFSRNVIPDSTLQAADSV